MKMTSPWTRITLSACIAGRILQLSLWTLQSPLWQTLLHGVSVRGPPARKDLQRTVWSSRFLGWHGRIRRGDDHSGGAGAIGAARSSGAASAARKAWGSPGRPLRCSCTSVMSLIISLGLSIPICLPPVFPTDLANAVIRCKSTSLNLFIPRRLIFFALSLTSGIDS